MEGTGMKFSRAVMAIELIVQVLVHAAKNRSIELKSEASKHVPF
jgi:hypothetical protein